MANRYADQLDLPVLTSYLVMMVVVGGLAKQVRQWNERNASHSLARLKNSVGVHASCLNDK